MQTPKQPTMNQSAAPTATALHEKANGATSEAKWTPPTPTTWIYRTRSTPMVHVDDVVTLELWPASGSRAAVRSCILPIVRRANSTREAAPVNCGKMGGRATRRASRARGCPMDLPSVDAAFFDQTLTPFFAPLMRYHHFTAAGVEHL